MSTEIQDCNCVSVLIFMVGSGARQFRPIAQMPFHTQTSGASFQDARYGKGKRVHNLGPKTSTCTVCGRSKAL